MRLQYSLFKYIIHKCYGIVTARPAARRRKTDVPIVRYIVCMCRSRSRFDHSAES